MESLHRTPIHRQPLYSYKPQPVRESFLLWNARIHYRALDWLTLFLKGENLLGEEYEINAGYPMPKTTAFGGFQLQF